MIVDIFLKFFTFKIIISVTDRQEVDNPSQKDVAKNKCVQWNLLIELNTAIWHIKKITNFLNYKFLHNYYKYLFDNIYNDNAMLFPQYNIREKEYNLINFSVKK